MSRTFEFYKQQELDRKRKQEEADFNQQFEDEQWYYEQMELLNSDEQLDEIPIAEEELFMDIEEDERNSDDDDTTF